KARSQGRRPFEPQVRQLVRPEQLRERSDGRCPSRPAVTADYIWFARSGRLLAFDRAGSPIPREQQILSPGYEPGNLLLVDGIVVSLRQRSFEVLHDAASLLQRVEARLRASPDDPVSILRLAGLRAALLPEGAPASALAEVQALYRRGLDACLRRGLPKNHPVRQALQGELFDQALTTALAALRQRNAKTLDLLVAAREAAPDSRSWVYVQSLVLAMCIGDPNRTRLELKILEQEAGDATFPIGDTTDGAPGGVPAGVTGATPTGSAPSGAPSGAPSSASGSGIPVRTYVLWQRALLAESQPTAAVLLWQDLLEHHGSVRLQGQTSKQVAQAAIARLVAAHGPAIYAEIAARAETALAASGDDPEALHAISATFPNSAAAAAASVRLLDRSVRNGDLASACRVLAAGPGAAFGDVAPGILRRVLVAALQRGNRGLARAMATRLQKFGDQISDWPEDSGTTYAAVLRTLAPRLAPVDTRIRVAVPRDEIARIPKRTPGESYRLLPVLIAEDFDRPPDEPLFVVSGRELLAIDLHAAGTNKPVLFSVPVDYLEHVVLCGTTLVVPDTERLFGIDYRTGAVVWDIGNEKSRLLEGLGVQQGVLHISAQPNAPDGSSEFLGIEPLTGSTLFQRKLPGDRLKPVPRSVQGQLLAMESHADGTASVQRLDPVSGVAIHTVHISAAVLQTHIQLQTDNLATRFYAQGLCADAERIFMPVDSSLSSDAPRLVAIDNQGQVSWQWTGRAGNRLLMAATRGERLLVVEGSERNPGRILMLSCVDGSVLRQIDLGPDITVLNWERSWLPNGAPPAVVLSDLADVGSRQRRLVCFGVDETIPTFEVPLANEDGEVERQPWFGDDFVTFGVRPAKGSSAFRLYSLNLRDRSGTLPGGAKYMRHSLGTTYGLTAVGTYTVVSSSLCLLVLGTDQGK
ncbi:MAG: hypothetical protein ABIP94_21390, partial [Planctomycetota bacterium]